MFCLYTKLSCPSFEFSLKLKVMGSYPGHLLKYFLLLKWCFINGLVFYLKREKLAWPFPFSNLADQFLNEINPGSYYIKEVGISFIKEIEVDWAKMPLAGGQSGLQPT